MPEAPERAALQAAIRTPKAAAFAGILFSILCTIVLVIVRNEIPTDPHDAGSWVTSGSKRDAMVFAVNLLPFAGIAFLWFIAVVRDQIGDREDRFFATAFLGSGLLFIAMLLAAGAAAASLLATVHGNTVPKSEAWRFGQQLCVSLMGVYALRMAAVFMAVSTTLARRVGLYPRWLIVFGYLSALALLVGVGYQPWFWVLFPGWVLLVSLHLLFVTREATG